MPRMKAEWVLLRTLKACVSCEKASTAKAMVCPVSGLTRAPVRYAASDRPAIIRP